MSQTNMNRYYKSIHKSMFFFYNIDDSLQKILSNRRTKYHLLTTTDQQKYVYKSYFSLCGCPVSCISDYTYPAFNKKLTLCKWKGEHNLYIRFLKVNDANIETSWLYFNEFSFRTVQNNVWFIINYYCLLLKVYSWTKYDKSTCIYKKYHATCILHVCLSLTLS